jgi:rhamnulokinase
LQLIPDTAGNEPVFARVIFESLAARYATVVADLARLTGRTFQKIVFLGGGSRNELLIRLTAESTGLTVIAGEAEGSTIGNFAVQLAKHDAGDGEPLSQSAISAWALRLAKSNP